MKIKALITIFLLTTISLFSQNQRFVSVNLNGLLATQSRFNLGFGISYEEQIIKHHGYEFGLYYRSKTREFLLTADNNNNYDIEVREGYLNLPISYKFYSNIVNFTTGISFDCFLGGKYLTEIPTIELSSYDIDPKLCVGWNFKIGKEIALSEKLILEPEIQYNPIFDYGYSFYGATIKLKYKL